MAKKKTVEDSKKQRRYTTFCRACRASGDHDAPLTKCQKCGSGYITLNDFKSLHSYVFPMDALKFNTRRVEEAI